MKSPRARFCGFLLALAAVCGCQTTEPVTGLTWNRQADSLALEKDGQIIWRFNYAPNESKPNFHPLALPDGPVLSGYRPKDHLWHRGLWFSWKYINKVNYWEEDKTTGKAAGRTEWSTPLMVADPDGFAQITMNLRYVAPNGETMLKEDRVISISPPDQKGEYHLDWDMNFTAVAPVVALDRGAPVDAKGNNISGGYAGLGIRGAANLDDTEVVTTEGSAHFDNSRFRGRSLALDFSGTVSNQTGGVAFLDYSENPNSPSPWYAMVHPPMYYISPAVLTYQPITLHAGQSVHLRYRVLVHRDRMNPADLGLAQKRYELAIVKDSR